MNHQEKREFCKMSAFFVGYTITEENERFCLRDPNNVLWSSTPFTLKDTKEKTYNFVLTAELESRWLGFYSDWNMIMQVIEKIENMGYIFNLKSSPTSIINSIIDCFYHIQIQKADFISVSENIFIVNGKSEYNRNESKKSAVVRALNQFLIYYNQKGQKT